MLKTKRTIASTIITAALALLAVPGFTQSGPAADPQTPGAQTSNPRPSGPRTSDEIRPFHVSIPEAALTDLRQRVQATRWPAMETVTDQSQGVKLAQIQDLVHY